MTSWIEIPADSDFTVANIPFGIFSTPTTPPRPCTRVGDDIFSLSILAEGGLFDNVPSFPRSLHHTFHTPTLNAFAALGPIVTNAVRKQLQWLFAPSSPDLRDNALLLSQAKLTLDQTPTPHLPFTIGDYTDFYAGRNHAYAVGTLFRGAENALNANYESLPIGYHGRSSSIVVSGTPVRRPHGQILRGDEKNPVHAPTEKLDFELELAAFVGVPSELGEPVNMRDAPNHIFGFVLMNDWSARDVQRWEYVPLGPFTSKSFATTVSPWVVTAAAVEGFRVAQMERWSKVPLLGYLKGEEGYKGVFDGRLEVGVAGETVGKIGRAHV